MSTSGSSDFKLVANQITVEAFDLCSIGSEGEAISADMYERARRSLNLIVKAWGANDHLWLRSSHSLTLVASTAGYNLTSLIGVKPLRVLEARRKVTAGSLETPLMEYSRAEYLEQPNKTSDSVPVAFYYDPQLSTGTFYLWPRPSTATATSSTVQLTYARPIEDFDGSADDADLPQEWLLALTYALAEQLALKYAVRPDLRAEISQRAATYKAQIEAWDTEPASIFMQPEARW